MITKSHRQAIEERSEGGRLYLAQSSIFERMDLDTDFFALAEGVMNDDSFNAAAAAKRRKKSSLSRGRSVTLMTPEEKTSTLKKTLGRRKKKDKSKSKTVNVAEEMEKEAAAAASASSVATAATRRHQRTMSTPNAPMTTDLSSLAMAPETPMEGDNNKAEVRFGSV